MKTLFYPLKLTCALIFALVSFSSSPLLAKKDKDDPGGDDGRPTQQGTTVNRGDCNKNGEKNKDLPITTALVPRENIHGGTERERPTFWFYLDYGANPPQSDLKAEFKILNQDGTNFYTMPDKISLPKTSGFFAITAPSNGDSRRLETNKSYNLYFTVICDEENPEYNTTIEKQVKRIEPNNRGNKAPQTKENMIWYDTVDNIMQRWCKDGSNSNKKELQDLLTNLQLTQLLERPINCSFP